MYNSELPKYQSGDKLKFNPNTVIKISQTMARAPWMRERLKRNGYSDSVRQDRIDSLDRLGITKDKLRISSFAPSSYNGYRDEIVINTEEGRKYGFNTSMGHEVGHAFSDENSMWFGNKLNNYEKDILTRNMKGAENPHDESPYERRADINALRVDLSLMGLFNEKTGKYKTQSGMFEPELLDKLQNNFVVDRFRKIYKDDDEIAYIMNTIAYTDDNNNHNNTKYYAQLGGLIKKYL